MKIAILNDETTETWMGGAALVNENIKKALEEKGHEVELCIQNKTRKDPIPNVDCYILANIPYFSNDDLSTILDKKYIVFRHDIPTILYTQPPSIRYKYWYGHMTNIFNFSKGNFFISPMQLEVFEKQFRKIPNSHVMPPPLSLDGFENTHTSDRHGCLYLGDISQARGCVETLQLMQKEHPDTRYTFVGQFIDRELVAYLRQNGAIVKRSVEHSAVPALMNEHKFFYYYPQIYDSFCLKILEAKLCGMEISADTYRIGYYSYRNKDVNDLKDMVNNSMDNIIQIIENGR